MYTYAHPHGSTAKTLLRLFSVLLSCSALALCAETVPLQEPALAPIPVLPTKGGLHLTEFALHDPCVLADPATKTYYLYTTYFHSDLFNNNPKDKTHERAGTVVYKSKDLASWEGPFLVFEAPRDSWAKFNEHAWAPEVHAYKGKYYLFTTLHNSTKTLPTIAPSRPNHARATIIAESSSPMGPFTLIKKDGPVTPADFMVLDGTLYVDPAGKPWMVYAHEWLQKIDGTIEAIPLKDNLSDSDGKPVYLFKGSDAPWINAQAIPSARPTQYVTDGPQLYRSKTGQLLMLWSSYERNQFGTDGYVETLARSKSGTLAGPWEQLEPLVGNDSGHGMLFQTFEGQLMMIVHQPFKNARGKLYEMEDLGDALRVTKYREDLSGPPLKPQTGQTPR